MYTIFSPNSCLTYLFVIISACPWIRALYVHFLIILILECDVSIRTDTNHVPCIGVMYIYLLYSNSRCVAHKLCIWLYGYALCQILFFWATRDSRGSIMSRDVSLNCMVKPKKVDWTRNVYFSPFLCMFNTYCTVPSPLTLILRWVNTAYTFLS